MATFTEFLSVYDDLREDISALQQQSARYAQQIQDLNSKLQRLMQQKANVDKQISTQSQNSQNQANATQAVQASNTQTSVAPSAAPGMNAAPGSTGVF